MTGTNPSCRSFEPEISGPDNAEVERKSRSACLELASPGKTEFEKSWNLKCGGKSNMNVAEKVSQNHTPLPQIWICRACKCPCSVVY